MATYKTSTMIYSGTTHYSYYYITELLPHLWTWCCKVTIGFSYRWIAVK